jgi:hypothetical protein
MLSLRFALAAACLMWWLLMSVAVAVASSLAGVAAETGVIMLVISTTRCAIKT